MYKGILISEAELASRVMSGASWSALVTLSDRTIPAPTVANNEAVSSNFSFSEHLVYAAALRYARSGDPAYRTKAANAIDARIDTDTLVTNTDQSLALARNIWPLVLAADYIDLPAYSTSLDDRFSTWISGTRTKSYNPRSLWSNTQYMGCNNWGIHSHLSISTTNIYIGDTTGTNGLNAQYTRFKGILGDRSAYADFGNDDITSAPWTNGYAKNYLPSSRWSAPIPIAALGDTKTDTNGVSRDVSGAHVSDQARTDEFVGLPLDGVLRWPPPVHYTYPITAVACLAALGEIFYRAGKRDVFDLQDKAIDRAADWLKRIWIASGQTAWFEPGGGTPTSTMTEDDRTCGWLLNYRYGAGRYPAYTQATPSSLHYGGSVPHLDFTHQGYIGYSNTGTGTVTPNFSFAPTAPTTADSVQFTDTSSPVPSAWSWSFGDGATSTVQNPTHTYASVGTFTVRLTATISGTSYTVTKTISVAAAGDQMKVYKASFLGATVTGNQTPSITVPFQPKCVLVYSEPSTDTQQDRFSDDARIGIGMATAATERCALSVSANPVKKTHTATKVISNITGDGSLAEADFVSFNLISGTNYSVTFNWTAVSATPRLHHCLFLGGSGLTNAKVLTAHTVPTTTGNAAITGAGFKPDAALALLPGPGSSVTTRFHHGVGFACTEAASGNLSQAVYQGQQIADGSLPSRYQSSGNFLYGPVPDSTHAQDFAATLVSFDADGLTLNYSDATAQGAGNVPVYFLLLKGGSYSVRMETQRGGVGTKQYSPGFGPSGLLLASFGRPHPSTLTFPDIGKLDFTLGSSDMASDGAIYFGGTNPAAFSSGGKRNTWEVGPDTTSITTANSDDLGEDAISAVSSAAITYSSAVTPAHGSFSMRVNATGTGIFVTFSGLNAGGAATTYGRQYFYIPVATSTQVNMVVLRNQVGGTIGQINFNTLTQVRAIDTAGVNINPASTTLVRDHWYRLEWKLTVDTVSGVAGELSGFVYDGDSTTPLSSFGGTSAGLGLNLLDQTRIGIANNVTALAYYDDTVVGASAFPGPAPDAQATDYRSRSSITRIWEDSDAIDVLSASAQHGAAITNGYELNWVTADTQAREGIVFAFGNVAQSPANQILPSVLGQLQLGSQLTADPGHWSGTQPISYTYQWQRDNAGGGTFANISGAASANYTIVTADVGNALRVVVTATNVVGSASANSASTGVVSQRPAAASNPTITGNATVGSTLTGVNGSWNGTATITYAYQWARTDTSGLNPVDIAGATATTYVVTSSDLAHRLRFTVTATNGAGSTTASALSSTVTSVTPPADTTVATPYPAQIGWRGTTTGMWRFATSTFGGTDVLGPGLPFGFGGPYDDMSPYLLSFTVRRGRSSTLTQMDMGECELVFNDQNGLFNPGNNSSPLWGSLQPWRPGRLQAVIGTQRFNLFNGYVRAIENNSDIGEKKTTVRLVDGFFKLDRVFPVISEMNDTTTGNAIKAVLGAAGFTDSTLLDIDTGDAIPGFTADGSKSALSLIEELLEAERGTFYFNGSGVAVYESRHARGARETVELRVVDTFEVFLPAVELDAIKNRARVTRFEITVDADGVSQTDGTQQVYTDTTSSDRYGLADVGDFSTRYLQTDEQALSLAKYLVDQVKDPVPRVYTLELSGIVGDDFRASLFALDLGAHVQVWNADNQAIEDAHIEAIEYRLAQKGDPLSINWTLSKRTQGPAWTFGVSRFGGDAVLTY